MKYLRATIELPGGAATDVWVPNLHEHYLALERLIHAVGRGGYIETTDHLPEESTA